MNNLPHQKRVSDELEELSAKRARLGVFLVGDAFKDLDQPEQSRLSRQYFVMGEYADILKERVAAFAALPPTPEIS
jgi:uncharacterized protein